jgi:hypothetical protein
MTKEDFVMACEKCGSETWSDDDLHWQWCKNPKCFNSYNGDNERTKHYDAEIAYKERCNIERAKEW